MLVKVKNLGNDFRTITAGVLPHNGITEIEPWEVRVWRHDPSKQIEIIEEEPKTKKKKK